MADLTGFEPATSGLTGRRALQTAPQVQGGENTDSTESCPTPRGAKHRRGPATLLWGNGPTIRAGPRSVPRTPVGPAMAAPEGVTGHPEHEEDGRNDPQEVDGESGPGESERTHEDHR